MLERFFRVPLPEIAYVRAIVEAYDGLAVLLAPNPKRGEISLTIGEGLEREAEEVIIRLVADAHCVEIARPADWP